MEALIQLTVSGLLVGASYGVLAAGLSLMFGVMKIINFAHGSFAVLAMYFPTFWFLSWWKIDPFVSAIISLPFFFALGYLLQRLLIERLLGSPGFTASTLIMTMGFAFFIESLILIVWSGVPRIINQPYTLATWKVYGIFINKAQGYSLVISLVLVVGLFLLLSKTMIGKGIRAAADDPEGCAYMGINLRSIYGVAFGLGLAITAAGGCLMATYRPFDPFYGQNLIILLFASVVMGGMSSIVGALLGGLIIGVIQQVSTLVISSSLQNAAVFVVFVLFLYFRPHGLLGRKERVI